MHAYVLFFRACKAVVLYCMHAWRTGGVCYTHACAGNGLIIVSSCTCCCYNTLRNANCVPWHLPVVYYSYAEKTSYILVWYINAVLIAWFKKRLLFHCLYSYTKVSYSIYRSARRKKKFHIQYTSVRRKKNFHILHQCTKKEEFILVYVHDSIRYSAWRKRINVSS